MWPKRAIPTYLAQVAGPPGRSLAQTGQTRRSDAWHAARDLAKPALLSGVLITAATLVLVSNLRLALVAGTPPSLALGVGAGWGLVALWLIVLPFWVLLADPARAGRGALVAAREAVVLLLLAPGRLLAIAVLVTAVLIAGTVLVAAVLTVAVAYAALVTARVVLPAADRLAGSPGLASPD